MYYRKIFSVLLVLIFLCSTAFGSVGVREEGAPIGAATDLNFVGANVTASGSFGTKTITITPGTFEVKDTTDTTVITAAESGKTWICKQDTKFQLPTPAEGLVYSFVSGADITIVIQVDTTPTTIVFVSKGDGDGSGGVIKSAVETTGTTVTVASDGTDWYITNMAGPSTSGLHFQDGGAWIQLDNGAQS